eukprot:4114666-Amphidinium_carterae.1
MELNLKDSNFTCHSFCISLGVSQCWAIRTYERTHPGQYLADFPEHPRTNKSSKLTVAIGELKSNKLESKMYIL